MFKSRLTYLSVLLYILFAFQIVCRDSSFAGSSPSVLENESPNKLPFQEANLEANTENVASKSQYGQPSEKATFGIPKKSLKGNLKFENPKELEVKLKYRRERFNAIVGFPLRLVMKVFSYIFSVFRGIFNLIKRCVGWSFYVTYWVVSKIASLFYKCFLLNPYNFARYLYYQYGTLIFFCSLPIMFGLLGGIFFATLSEGTIQVLSLYLFPKDPELNESTL